MPVQGWSSHRVNRGQQGEEALLRPRVALSEVQIDGIPKASTMEVASTA
jgi:hypothetical protein